MHSRGTHLMIAYGIFQFSLHSEYFFLQTLRYLHIFLLRLFVFPPCSKIRPILAREEEDGKPSSLSLSLSHQIDENSGIRSDQPHARRAPANKLFVPPQQHLTVLT